MLFAPLLALLLAAPTKPAPPQRAPLLAVLELHSKLKGQQREDVDVAYLTDVVRATALKQVPGLRVMTRENMLVLLGAAGKKPEDCEGTCEVDTGRLLGADHVISGEALRFGSAFKLNLKLHETSEGRLLSGAQASGRDLDELDRSIQAAVRELVAPLSRGKGGSARSSEDSGGPNGIEGGTEGGEVGGVFGGIVGVPGTPPPPPGTPAQPRTNPFQPRAKTPPAQAAEQKPQAAERKPAQEASAAPPPAPPAPPKVPAAPASPGPAAQKPVEPAPLPLRAPAPEITAPAPAPAASGGLGLGLYLGGALDASGKTVGGQAALVIGAGGPWMVTAGVAIAPHPGARVSVAASLYESSGVSVAAEPRVSLTPFNGSTVLGGGLGARLSVHAAPWLDVVAGAGLEFDKFPGSTLVIPLFTLGLEPHL